MLCRALGLFAEVSVAIDGSKFKAVNNRDKNFTRAKMERRLAQIEESVARYLQQLDSADRQEPSEARATKTIRLREKIAKLKEEMQRLYGLKARMLATPDQQISLTDPDSRVRRYRTNACQSCSIKHKCTTGKERLISRWEHEHVIEAVQRRLDEHPEKMRQRRETVEHPFGTIKARMGATHFLMKTLPRVASEMALHVLAYNLTRMMNIMGIQPLMAAMRA